MKIPDETSLISGIRAHDSEVLEHIYQSYFPMIEGFVVHHKGTRDQAKDVFQEAMIVIYNRVRAGELELSCKFGTYLYAVCKKIWIQERKKYLLHQDKLKQHPMTVHDPGPEEDPLLQQHLTRIFLTHFRDLSPDCQKILSMYFNDYSLEEIRKALNYNNLHHTADRKYRCKKSLIKRILNDPLFKRLKNEQR
ncbi:MAG: RNA polymerase sigma factor [Bacteroidales bacterium]